MKTLSEFKKRLKIGTKLQAIHHLTFAGRDTEGKVIYKDSSLGIREISIVQSNSFALKTVRTTGETVDSWCSYPKASECIFKDENTLTILEEQRTGEKIPVLTYTFMD